MRILIAVDGTDCSEAAIDSVADFVVVGSHGRRGVTHLFLGSVAEAIVHKAPCSVEVIKMPHPVKSTAAVASTKARSQGKNDKC
ncbi:MAG TPA: universal stress protein [Oculatellaceae cyanobacterium]